MGLPAAKRRKVLIRTHWIQRISEMKCGQAADKQK
jgi:hypothetical protein